MIQCYVSFGSLLSESPIHNKLPTDVPCCKKIKEQHYTEQRIRKVCKLSWNIENCMDGFRRHILIEDNDFVKL